MVSKKRRYTAACNNTKEKKISTEQHGTVKCAPAKTSVPRPSDLCVEFVTIKEEPVDISSPTSSYGRPSPVDPSPRRQPKKFGKAKRPTACELCLRKCLPTLVVQFTPGRGTNLDDGLKKVEQTLGIQLKTRSLSVCWTCWQLVEIVATFKDACLKVRNWRMLDGGACRDETRKDEWFSGKTLNAMKHALQVAQANLDYFSKESEEMLELENISHESSFTEAELNVKDEAAALDEIEDLDETTESQTILEEYSNVTENLEITFEEHSNERAIETDKAKIKLPTDLTPLPVYECTKCGRRFDSKNGLGVHVRRTEDSPDAICKNSVPLESPHCCTVCMLYFKTKSLLKCHMDKHMGTKSLACRKGCGKMFYTGAMLRVHEHDCGTELGKRLCPHCGLNFVSTSHLIRHMTQVHGEANFPCKVCGKRFKTREAVGRHMNYSHSTENTLSCSLCDKKYKNPDSLRVHMRLHTNEMPYGCNICGKRFRYGHAVRPHKLKEHGAEQANVEETRGGGEVTEEGGDGTRGNIPIFSLLS